MPQTVYFGALDASAFPTCGAHSYCLLVHVCALRLANYCGGADSVVANQKRACIEPTTDVIQQAVRLISSIRRSTAPSDSMI